MARKYEKLFVTKNTPGYKNLAYINPNAKTTKRIACIDQNSVKGAEFGCENIWLLPGGPKEQKIMDANTQKHDRYFGFFSFYYDNIRDLCAEMEVYIGGEKHLVKESGAMFIPAGLEVGPLTFRNITKPIFFTIEFPCGEGLKKKYQ
ncbi:MAG: hypothetical protein JXA17_03005 [Dehalococcoidales bacterium]|nr:hypothetical protein [Dehalococcoidales bacterium]